MWTDGSQWTSQSQPNPASLPFHFPLDFERVFSVEGGDVRVPEAPSWVAGTVKDLHMKPMNISSLMAWAQMMVLTDGRHRD